MNNLLGVYGSAIAGIAVGWFLCKLWYSQDDLSPIEKIERDAGSPVVYDPNAEFKLVS